MSDIQNELMQAQIDAAAEKKAQELLHDPKYLRLQLFERTKELVETKQELASVSADYTRLVDSEGNYAMKDAAKLLKYKRGDGKQVGRTELFAFLRDLQVLNRNNTPAQTSIDNGWLDEVTGTYVANGVEYNYVKTVVTPKGLERIRRFLEDSFEEWWGGK